MGYRGIQRPDTVRLFDLGEAARRWIREHVEPDLEDVLKGDQ